MATKIPKDLHLYPTMDQRQVEAIDVYNTMLGWDIGHLEITCKNTKCMP